MILLLMLLTSCLRYKNLSFARVDASQEVLTTLKSSCKSLTKDYDVADQIKEIKRNFGQIMSYLRSEDPTSFEDEITGLATEIKESSRHIAQMVAPEWSTPRWKYHYSWKLTKRDFRPNVGSYFPRGVKITHVEVVGVYLFGDKRDDLKEHIQIMQKKRSFEVNLHHLASSLDLCQLNRTLIITVKARFKSLKMNKTKHFNLYVSKEALLKF